MTWNAKGIMTGTPYLCSLLHTVDIVCIQEHWLYPEQLHFFQSVDRNFMAFSRSDSRISSCPWERKRPSGFGGTAIFYRKSLPVRPLNNIGNDRVIGVEINLCAIKLFLFCVWFPSTNACLDDYKEIMETVECLYDEYNQKGCVIICGDFNAELPKTVIPKGKYGKGYILQSFLKNRHLISTFDIFPSVIPGYTYCSSDGKRSSMIDYILIPSSKIDLVINANIEDDHHLNVSDHLPVRAELLIPEALLESTFPRYPVTINWQKVSPEQQERYRNEINEHLNSMELYVNSISDVQNTLVTVATVLRNTADNMFPKKTFLPHLKPYWKFFNVAELHKEMRRKRLLWIKDERPRGTQFLTYAEYKNAKRYFRKQLNDAKYQYEQEQLNELERAAELDVGKFYRIVRLHKKGQRQDIYELKVEGEIIRDPDLIRDAWCQHFKLLSTEIPDINFNDSFAAEIRNTMKHLVDSNIDDATDKDMCETILPNDIEEAIQELKKNKSCGHDNICAEHLMFARQSISNILCKIYNSLISLEMYPDYFKLVNVIPIFKGGKKDRLDMNNYRDISIVPVFQKVFEKILLKRLILYSDKIGFPHPLQQGFRSECSGITAAFIIKEGISHYLERQSKVYAAFLDNAKAFNTVWHDGLFYKLFHLGINGKMWRLIRDSFQEVRAHVLLHGHLSKSYAVNQGVGQGRTLSAWLFLVMINDLISLLESTKSGIQVGTLSIPCVLLADDTSLLSSSFNGMCVLLRNLNQYASKWRLRYNADKSNIVIFSKKKITHKSMFMLGNKLIPIVSSRTYAGVTLSTDLSNTIVIKNACDKGRSVFYSIVGAGIGKDGMNPINSATIWSKVVLPAMTYGCELWSSLSQSQVYDLEVCQRKAARRIIGLDQRSCTETTISSLGLWTIEGYVDKIKLGFFNKICRAKGSFVWKNIFHRRILDFLIHEKNSVGFVKDIYRILLKYQLGDFFHLYVNTLYSTPKSAWRRNIEMAVHCCEESVWRSKLEMRPELLHYASVHTHLQPLAVWKLGKCVPKKTWSFAKIAYLTMCPITIENENNCKLCKKLFIDRAKHMLLFCSALNDERNTMFEKIIDAIDIRDSHWLLCQDNDTLLHILLGKRVDIFDSMDD